MINQHHRKVINMTAVEKFSDGALRKMAPQKLHVLIGEIMSLMLASKSHRQYQVRDISDVLFPAINLGQYTIYRDQNRQPIALVTWGRLSAKVEKEYLAVNHVLSEKELASGDRLYIMEFIAPYGHTKQVEGHLRKHVFPNECAHHVRPTGDVKSPVKITKLNGVNYKKRLN
ncbi:MAG: hypothetical protein DI582_08115 [Azospirillum brasilense]|nr:MAG: hypothetical protein DI582_08115 [Azospirillum brasilense]